MKLNYAGLALKLAIALATPTVFAMENSLPEDAITVGCNRRACKVGEAHGVVANGFIFTYMKQVEQGLPIHDHPGLTVDLQAKDKNAKGDHIQENWLEFPIEKINYRSCIFLEQLSPIAYNPSGSEQAMDPMFMPKAIQKARDVLKPGGQLVIHLALHSVIDDSAPDQLETKRNVNPFCGYFNGSLVTFINKVFQCYNENDLHEKKGLVYDAVRFYNQKIDAALEATLSEIRRNNGSDQAINSIKSLFKETFQLHSGIPPFNYTAPQEEEHPSFNLIVKVCFVFKQQEKIIQYLNNNGFRNAKLEWLERGSHTYNPSAGFFVRAVAHEGGTPAQIEREITKLLNEAVTKNVSLIMEYLGAL